MLLKFHVSCFKKKKLKKEPKVSWFRAKIRKFVVCDHFTRGILVAILVNTLSMGVEYHQQVIDPILIRNLILAWIPDRSARIFQSLLHRTFCFRNVAQDHSWWFLRLPLWRIQSLWWWNCSAQVGTSLLWPQKELLSVLELFQEGKGGLSVLRTFRLLRILKLVRFMPALRYQLVVMLRTMDNVTVFFGLLVLFIFIFRYEFPLFLFSHFTITNDLPSLHILFTVSLAWTSLGASFASMRNVYLAARQKSVNARTLTLSSGLS